MDGHLKVTIGAPKELGGTGEFINPGQIFAVGYATCFLGTMKVIAAKRQQVLPPESKVECQVNLGPVAAGMGMEVWLKVHLSTWPHAEVEKMVAIAHAACPYSIVVRGNVSVHLSF